MLFKMNKVESELSNLTIVVRQLTDKVSSLQTEVETLARKAARIPEPARANWIHKSAPAWELETITLPLIPAARLIAARNSRKLAQLNPPPKSRVARVTICMSGAEQFVNAYDIDGNKLTRYCGRFHDVGLEVLEAAGSLQWEVVAESA